MVVYPMKHAREVAQHYNHITRAAPDELCCLLILRLAPPAPFLPGTARKTDRSNRRLLVGQPGCRSGYDAFSQELWTPAADTITTKSFIAHQTMLDAGQPFGTASLLEVGLLH